MSKKLDQEERAARKLEKATALSQRDREQQALEHRRRYPSQPYLGQQSVERSCSRQIPRLYPENDAFPYGQFAAMHQSINDLTASVKALNAKVAELESRPRGLLCDREIRALIEEQNMIVAGSDVPYNHAPISSGVTSCGYDLRVGFKVRSFVPLRTEAISEYLNGRDSDTIDPLAFDDASLVDLPVCSEAGRAYVELPANSINLAPSLEHLNMPDYLTGFCLGKSTYARVGVHQIVTPLEAGWQGTVTLEFVNSNPNPVKLYLGLGALQVLFLPSNRPDQTYADKGGKYQHQTGITYAK